MKQLILSLPLLLLACNADPSNVTICEGGACASTCDTGDPALECYVECAEGEACEAQCNPGQDCTFLCNGASSCDFDCAHGNCEVQGNYFEDEGFVGGECLCSGDCDAHCGDPQPEDFDPNAAHEAEQACLDGCGVLRFVCFHCL